MNIIESCFNLGEEVRYAALFSQRGRLLAGGMRPGTESLEPSKRARDIDRATAIYAGKLIALHPYLGRLNFIHICMGKLNVYVIPQRKNLLVVTSRTDIVRRLLPLTTRQHTSP